MNPKTTPIITTTRQTTQTPEIIEWQEKSPLNSINKDPYFANQNIKQKLSEDTTTTVKPILETIESTNILQKIESKTNEKVKQTINKKDYIHPWPIAQPLEQKQDGNYNKQSPRDLQIDQAGRPKYEQIVNEINTRMKNELRNYKTTKRNTSIVIFF